MKKSTIGVVAAYALTCGATLTWGIMKYVDYTKLWENGGPKVEHVLLRTTPEEEGISVYKIKKPWGNQEIPDAQELYGLLKSSDFPVFRKSVYFSL